MGDGDRFARGVEPYDDTALLITRLAQGGNEPPAPGGARG